MLSLTRQAASLARGVILMTEQQVASAKADLGHKVPIVRLRVGVDTQFYGRQSTDTDVPDEHRKIVESLVRTKYLILPGDELRLNDDALDVVEMTGIRLVRISQYRYKSGTNRLQQEIERRGLRDRLVLFERISYSFLRFLLQHATAYAGFVDASWQPAGWTVACESLASGLPLVMYDGLTARELIDLGIPRNLLQVIEPGDRTTFAEQLDKTMRHSGTQKIKLARAFAEETLNLEQTGPEFAHDFMVNFGRVV
jgi:glycosyltransferase involved in cell wall biosynthesis